MQLFENRYIRLTLLALVLGLLFWAIIWLTLRVLGLSDFPVGLQLAVAFLGSGLIITKFLSSRIF